MNTENRYPVNASLFMLGEIKRRQENVTRGYQLLKRKAEALRIRGRQAAVEMVNTQVLIGHTLKEAYITLAAIKFTNGDSNALVLENVGQAKLRVQRVPENISGVATVSLQAVEDPTISDVSRYAGLASGGHRTAEAKKAFRDVLRIIVKFASLRNTCILLDDSVKTTLRKLNGIEKVILPKLKNTESYIIVEMDERVAGHLMVIRITAAHEQLHCNAGERKREVHSGRREWMWRDPALRAKQSVEEEREEFHRLKMVKAKKIRTQYSIKTARRPVEQAGESGDSVASSMPSSSRKSDPSVQHHPNTTSASVESGGDYQPVCYPHYWDDDDLLF